MIKLLSFEARSDVTASREELLVFESQLGLSLPQSFVEFCRHYNGGLLKRENGFYRVPEHYQEFYEEFSTPIVAAVGVIVIGLYGLSNDLKACNVSNELESLREVSSIRLFPIGFDLFGNQAVLREDEIEGPVYWRDHELWQASSVPMLFPIAEDLEFFYNGLGPRPE